MSLSWSEIKNIHKDRYKCDGPSIVIMILYKLAVNVLYVPWAPSLRQKKAWRNRINQNTYN